uniref:THAP-type domain-containing protein n=1 Tax=Chelydra serpentina TaxID=8475 RepID=A0A8C3XWN9_CHESE
MWEPKKADVLCSRHFKKSDFDARGPNIRLKPGVIPSIFEFPSHFQRRRGKVRGRRNTPLKTLPVTAHNHQLVDSPSSTGEFHSQFILVSKVTYLNHLNIADIQHSGEYSLPV